MRLFNVVDQMYPMRFLFACLITEYISCDCNGSQSLFVTAMIFFSRNFLKVCRLLNFKFHLFVILMFLFVYASSIVAYVL